MLKVEHIKNLTHKRRAEIMSRSAAELGPTMRATLEILDRLRADPEAELLREYGPLKKDLRLRQFEVGPGELEEAFRDVSPRLIGDLETAAGNIKKFHEAQLERSVWFDEFAPGLIAGRMTRPMERVGVYIPGGRAAYPSSALMNIIPAKVAGVSRIVAVTPPGPDFKARPEIIAAAVVAGADVIYKLGGAWAVGALAYGLGGLPKVDKIVGPGSLWVTAAKMAVFGQVDIDMPAGPSEGFIIADCGAEPEWLAWDLLSQLEHDPQAAAVLVSTDSGLAEAVKKRVAEILPTLERREIVVESIKAGGAILVADDLDEAFDFANEYAPEHLQIILTHSMNHLTRVKHAGSVFLGGHSPIPVGDYASGPNHVLPTGGAARMFSGLSTDSFLKKISFQRLTPEALEDLAPTVERLARAEGLPAHAEAVAARFKKRN